MAYITTDESGKITSCADWNFPGSTFTPYDVTRYPDGLLYRADALPPVYARPGSAEQRVGGECSTGWVFPTPVGVFPVTPRVIVNNFRLPHTRGGVSVFVLIELWMCRNLKTDVIHQ